MTRVATACISSDENNGVVLEGGKQGAYKVVFFTPEMLLLNKQWRALLKSQEYTKNLCVLIVDEAHAVKKW